ncbi:hypothetical protein BDV96DRAFT_652064 [Lophiotrema nucula]|uniref:Uncharacterized protein n=1 Tax=Lophiotrema nucula TaxID=690887 RepID=A0A6A5YPY6_9PLEO|nr:hypothetical protein BDV96DRAFT_652064 [Lophiotrema nucula]
MPSDPNYGHTAGYDKHAKAAGYKSFKQFLEIYGLSIYKPEDIEEGKAILDAMRGKTLNGRWVNDEVCLMYSVDMEVWTTGAQSRLGKPTIMGR